MIPPFIEFDPFLAEPVYHLFSGPSRNVRRNHISVRAMLDKAIFHRIRTAAGRFAGANQGNIAVIFGIAAVPIITVVGAAIDYTRATAARTSMRAALDSTALMLAKDLSDGTIQTSQIGATAQAYFTALYANKDANSVTISALNAPAETSGSVYKHIIILFTDGLNTGDRWYGDFSSQSSQVDTRMETLCTNIKATGVTIYTVQIDTDGA